MSFTPILLIILFFIVVGFVIAKSEVKPDIKSNHIPSENSIDPPSTLGFISPETRFRPKSLLSLNELEFLNRLENSVPELRFHTQVAMGALLDPDISRKDIKEFLRVRGMFAQKIVDFVAQNRHDGSIVALIELDDRTHDLDKDAKRDLMLTSAGYRVIRWQSRAKPTIAVIRAALIPAPIQQLSIQPSNS